MKKQQGFINITGGQMAFVCIVIGLIGWAVVRTLEWVWPFIKLAIHAATA